MDGLENLTRVLQASIAPVALISGVGLLILSLSNRLGRVMDRLRELLDRRRSGASDSHIANQIAVLHRRARILRSSLTAGAICVLLASALVLLLFTMAIFAVRLEVLVMATFGTSLVSLITSLVFFIVDMNQSLRAVEEELLR